jgi:hypothetical protein
VGEEGQSEGDQKEDTNGKGLVLECILKAINAVLSRRWGSDGLEVVEHAWVADTVTV